MFNFKKSIYIETNMLNLIIKEYLMQEYNEK